MCTAQSLGSSTTLGSGYHLNSVWFSKKNVHLQKNENEYRYFRFKPRKVA